jgi:hypothetical protein
MPSFLLRYDGIVSLPERYKEKFKSRPELKKFENRIEWLTNDQAVISACDTLFIAQLPERQEVLLASVIGQPNISFLLLEKPLARTPVNAMSLLNRLTNSGKTFRIMYSFLYLEWFKKLSLLLKDKTNCLVELNWQFNAHHFLNDLPVWKRFHSQGGGVVRFYGIHLIAMAAALHFKEVVSSETLSLVEDEPYAWNALFTEKSGNKLRISINSMSDKKEFSVQLKNASDSFLHISETDPFFEYTCKDGLDSRIDLNMQILRSLFEEEKQYDALYNEINQLWADIEKRNA